MDAFHERLATIGLAAAGRYGFALADLRARFAAWRAWLLDNAEERS